MKVLVVGGGGREHALVWLLSKSSRVKKLFCAPGNAGIAELAKCIDISAEDIDGLARFAHRERLDLTIVGPEAPLAAGIVDRWEKDRLGLIFGPSGRAAELEGSKIFAKDLMRRHGIPTAGYQAFSDPERAHAYIEEVNGPLVVKADGLAAGKGVTVASTVEEAKRAVDEALVEKVFGEAGKRVLIEEKLVGEEVSIIALTDGRVIAVLPSSQDHKAVFDNDAGPNTGGMGAYSPAPAVTEEVLDRIVGEILVPTVHAMGKEGRRFRGVLYAGLMLTKTGPRVLEFNVRFGDPEAQPLLMRLKSDLLELILAVLEDRLGEVKMEWDDRPAICVVLASGGYPGHYEKGLAISGLEEAAKVEDAFVFHAGTARGNDGGVVTAGGRVLGVTALGADLPEAIARAYSTADLISFEGSHRRGDIGAKALARTGAQKTDGDEGR